MISIIALVVLISYIISLLIGVLIIPKLKKYKLKQVLNRFLLVEHSKKKDTPTFGGVIFISSVLITILLLLITDKIDISFNMLIVIITMVLFAVIGFIDDYLIIKRNSNNGLSSFQKLSLQIIASIIIFYLFLKVSNEPLLWIRTIDIKLDVSFMYGIFFVFMLVGSSNAVNLTDGLDGLAAGLSVIAFLTLGIITKNEGWLIGSKEISIICFSLVGSLFGFLAFNNNPAKIFMGDTGSLSLGASLGIIAILAREEFVLLLIGFVYFIETLSVIIQVVYFKITHGKRLFKMTPIHHSFEKSGMKEQDIVRLFWTVGLLLSLIVIAFDLWI